jgi:lipopolysaccharide/colanic/teichoic acid biosynthesis glycosyltransferase
MITRKDSTMEMGKSFERLSDYSSLRKSDKKTVFLSQVPSLSTIFIEKVPVWKRTFDIAMSLFALLVLLPIFSLIAILVKTASPGPLLFKQKRVGWGGKVFNLYKFRTMTSDADSSIHQQYLSELMKSCNQNGNAGDPMTKLHQDTRIIKYGHFLRAAGLDELPQLFNVLMGQMSLVGPRPPIPYEVEQYKLWHKGRFDVVPGLTGLWQTSGKNKLGFNEMVRLDIQYAMNRSFLLDCIILLKTPFVVYSQLKEMPYRQTH